VIRSVHLVRLFPLVRFTLFFLEGLVLFFGNSISVYREMVCSSPGVFLLPASLVESTVCTRSDQRVIRSTCDRTGLKKGAREREGSSSGKRSSRKETTTREACEIDLFQPIKSTFFQSFTFSTIYLLHPLCLFHSGRPNRSTSGSIPLA
jgi:hypothetical protein